MSCVLENLALCGKIFVKTGTLTKFGSNKYKNVLYLVCGELEPIARWSQHKFRLVRCLALSFACREDVKVFKWCEN